MRKIIFALVIAVVTVAGGGHSCSQTSTPLPLQAAGQITGGVIPSLQVQGWVNDPLYNQQGYLNKIKVDKAWDITTGSDLTIAVIDTGANISHEELTNRLWVNPGEIPNNQKDDDGNGYVDDYYGYNFLANNSNLDDEHGHGTGITSIIAANSNNWRGIAGINWRAKVMILKALNNLGGGEFEDVSRAIRYAADNGAKVINMSFGASTGLSVLSSAVDYAISKGVVIVAAAGNDGQNRLLYPARYPQVISVGSINNSDQKSSFTNYGDGLDLAAIGEDITMASIGSPSMYTTGSGSSFAAAQVTGVVSLMLAQHPQLSPAQVEEILDSTTDHIGDTSAGYTTLFGWGRVNAQAAVAYAPQTLHSSAQISNNRASANGLDTITVTTTIADESSQPKAGIDIQASISGTNNIVNGQLVPFGGMVDLGRTDQSGRISFQLSSTVAETKQISITTTAGSTALAAPLQVTFTSLPRTRYTMQWIKQSPYLNMSLGTTAAMWLQVKNTGNVAWVSDPNARSDFSQTRLGTDHPHDRSSNFYDDSSWLSPNRLALMTPSIVRPGETATFALDITARQIGSFREYFGVVVEHVTWLNDLGIFWDINVTTSGQVENSNDEQAVQVNQDPSAYQAVVQAKTDNLTLFPGETAMVSVDLRNVGTALWLGQGVGAQHLGEVRLGTAMPRDRSSRIFLPSWISSDRALAAGFNVPPNSNLTLTFTIKAPDQQGVYQENFQLVSEYITWFGPVFGWTITVT